jgi:hypothetical protein
MKVEFVNKITKPFKDLEVGDTFQYDVTHQGIGIFIKITHDDSDNALCLYREDGQQNYVTLFTKTNQVIPVEATLVIKE